MRTGSKGDENQAVEVKYTHVTCAERMPSDSDAID